MRTDPCGEVAGDPWTLFADRFASIPVEQTCSTRTFRRYGVSISATSLHSILNTHIRPSQPHSNRVRHIFAVPSLRLQSFRFPTEKHFAAWLALCPRQYESNKDKKKRGPRKGKNRAASALRLAAWGLMRGKSYFGAYLRRQRSRLGAPKAITATATSWRGSSTR